MKKCQWQKIFFVGFFLLPFVINSKAQIPYEVPRVIFFLIWIKLLAVFGIFCLTVLRTKKFEKGILISAAAYLLVATLLSLKGVDIPKSFLGNLYRKDGLFTYYHLFGFSILVFWFWRRKLKTILAGAIFVQVFYLSLAVIFYFFKLHGLEGKFFPPFGNINFLAGYLVCSLPFFYYSSLNFNLAKIWKILLYALPVIAIILTKASGAIAIMVLLLGFIILEKSNLSLS